MGQRSEENRIQTAFVKLANMYLHGTGRIGYANPNQGTTGGKTGTQAKKQAMIQGAKMKREGKVAGIPDWFLAWGRLGYHGLYIEFKLETDKLQGIKRSNLSTAQKNIVPMLRDAGYCVAVCRDAIDAFELLKRYTIGADRDAVMRDHNWK